MSARAKAAAATRERLLAAAWQHFATHPYEDVRLQEIAAEAGVTAQTLHPQFGSKDQLLTAAYVWFGEQEITQRDTAPAGRHSSGDRAPLRPLRGARAPRSYGCSPRRTVSPQLPR